MAYKCKILADSLNAKNNARLTTFEVTYPRFVHSELMTHRAFSRNSASSRAIPVKKMIDDLKNDPVFPVFFGKNQKGMQAVEELSPHEIEIAKAVWLEARDNAITSAEKLIGIKKVSILGTEPNSKVRMYYKDQFIGLYDKYTYGAYSGNDYPINVIKRLLDANIEIEGFPSRDLLYNHGRHSNHDSYNDYIPESWKAKVEELLDSGDVFFVDEEGIELGLHKQIANRLLEPWMWITVIVSATSYGNFFNLRCHPDAQPEIKKIAEMMRDEYYNNEPRILQPGEWHLPLLQPEDEGVDIETLIKVSVGRVARVSYLTHDGIRDLIADVSLHDRLSTSGHWSPFEHVAKASEEEKWFGNFFGYEQYRQMFPNENRTIYVPPTIRF